MFDVSGEIVLSSPLVPKSNKTIDGRGQAINVRGKDHNVTGFKLNFQALNWTGSRLSFGYNYCTNVSRPCIQMIKGKGHSYNNLIKRWGRETIQNAKDGAQILSENNIWRPGNFVR